MQDTNEIFLIKNVVEFDPSNQLISSSSGDIKIKLTNIVSKMLHYLCVNNKTVNKYGDVMQFVWGERHTQTNYGSLYQALLVLRKSLNEISANDKIEINSIRKEGILLNAEVKKLIKVNSEHIYIKSRKIKTFNIYKITPFFNFIIIIFISIMLIFFFSLRNHGVFNNYTNEIPSLGKCKMWFNSDAIDSSQHIKFIKKHIELCVPESNLYITAYKNINKISVVQCSNNYLDVKKIGNCTVKIFHRLVNLDDGSL
ncbi:hypothetical protein QP353_23770 [Klebsiella aerogenes]|uniref:winged helix-turn-helix domain-containing protein n=1 Tax=Klebsiella aerogenes TaxID=548 RepID=UPI00254BD0B2|nr:hypothetical protein [Klebsiella aerogenes]MDK6932421.1 hypothetical protein [Klebsiella aerogenes]